jgi:N-sulfoglucosamine sulfohydrolase
VGTVWALVDLAVAPYMENDPDEIHNLAGDPGHATLLDELKSKLKAFQKRTGDPWLLKWEYE